MRIAPERLIDVVYRPPVPLHTETLPATFPAPQVRQKTPRQSHWWPPFFRFSGASRPPVEDPLIEVYVAQSGHSLESGCAHGAGARTGIKGDQYEARDMAARVTAGRVSFLDFAVAPGIPNQPGRFAARQPSLARQTFPWQDHADDPVAVTLFAMKINRGA
jgi:hypothetical protein